MKPIVTESDLRYYDLAGTVLSAEFERQELKYRKTQPTPNDGQYKDPWSQVASTTISQIASIIHHDGTNSPTVGDLLQVFYTSLPYQYLCSVSTSDQRYDVKMFLDGNDPTRWVVSYGSRCYLHYNLEFALMTLIGHTFTNFSRIVRSRGDFVDDNTLKDLV